MEFRISYTLDDLRNTREGRCNQNVDNDRGLITLSCIPDVETVKFTSPDNVKKYLSASALRGCDGRHSVIEASNGFESHTKILDIIKNLIFTRCGKIWLIRLIWNQENVGSNPTI